MLYRGVTGVVRTRDLRRVLHGLLGYLSSFVEPADDEFLRLDAVSLVKDGVAVLVPAEVRSALPTIERRLHAKGIGVADRPWATVDIATGQLVLGEPQLAVDWAVLDELASSEMATGKDGPVAPGRYPLVGWGFGVGPDTRGPISRAVAVTLAGARLVDRDALSSQDALERLARVLTPLEPVALWADRPEDLVGPLVGFFGDHGAPAPGG